MSFINNRKQHLSFSKGDWTKLIFDCFKFKRILEIVSVGDWFIHFKNIENKSLSQLYKPESSDPSTEDDCEESTEDLLESTSVFFLRLKILPGRLSVPAKVPASEEDPPTSLEVGGKRSSPSDSDDIF